MIRIVITGATGTIGRPLTELLTEADVEVRAITRAPQAADLPANVEVVEGDPSKPETIAAALDGATALFLNPRAVGDAASDLVALASEFGVRRVVALAAANVDDDVANQPSRHRGDRNREAEQAAVDSGLEWTSLRPATFAINALYAWGDQIRAGDVVRYVHAAFEESPIHERDLAEVASRALLTDELLAQRIELTGPQSLSHKEMVAVIGEVIGRPLRFEEVPSELAAQGMVSRGFPEPFVTAMMARYAAHLGQPQHPANNAVEKILGRPARTFSEWVADHADAFGQTQG